MLRHLPFRTLWGILRETDLESIRRGAESRFQILVASDDAADAEQLGRLIGESADTASEEKHPWLLTIDASMAATIISREPFNLAVLVTRNAELSASLASIRDDQSARGVPIVVVVIGATGKTAAIVRHGESRRIVTSPELNVAAFDAVGNALLAAVPPELIMLGNTIPTASTVVTAARRCGPKSVAGCRGTSSPPGIRQRGLSCPANAQQSGAHICADVAIVRKFSGNLVFLDTRG